MPLVKSVRRRRNACPGTTTEHAKLRRPINDWTSFKVAFLRCRNFERRTLDLAILSTGKRASNNLVSNSIPQMSKWFEDRQFSREQSEYQDTRKAIKNSSSQCNIGHRMKLPLSSHQECGYDAQYSSVSGQPIAVQC